ncbi:MAG: photosystem I assembly protein Ycf3 [Bacteroidetes bacterium ADurb.Bin217]|nr:MAG: photosystem I assembly protein Ycf3 [Bacteroidetes bacterium ADurb.Bin217]
MFFIIGDYFEVFTNKLPQLRKALYGIGIFIMLILCYLTFERTKVWESSFSLWADLLDKHPNIANIDKAYYGIANHYYKAENTEDPTMQKSYQDSAIKYFKGAIYKNPNNEKALNNLGNAYYQRQQYDSAYIYYNRLVTIKPNYTLGLQNMGNYYYVKGQFDTAIEYYNRILSNDPNYALTYYTLGLVYQSKSLTNTNIANRHSSTGDSNTANQLNMQAQIEMQKANEYFQKAARLGSPEAIKILSNK